MSKVNGGKHICLVVQPIISLMTDQMEKLKKMNVPCVRLTQEDSPHVDDETITEAEVVIASPEAILVKYRHLFNNVEFSSRLSLIAIDESHIICQWYEF